MTFSDDKILCIECGCPVDFEEPVIKSFMPRVGDVFFCSVACYQQKGSPQETMPDEEKTEEESSPFIDEAPL